MIGKKLRVDVSRLEWSSDSLETRAIRDRLGGTGLALKTFTEDPWVREGGGGVVFAPGLMAGTNAPAAHWCSAVYQDPSKKNLSVSYFGGHWGSGLKQAGVHVLEIAGQAPSMMLLVIENENVRFLDAGDLAGLSTREAYRRIGALYGDDYRVACVGPAGEKGLPFSSLLFEGGYQRNSAGLGARLGLMGIKAILVKGDEKITPAMAQEFYEESRRLRKRFAEPTFPFRDFSTIGSGCFLNRVYEEGLLPIRNYRTSVLDGFERLAGGRLPAGRKGRHIACSGCPVGCRLKAETLNGWAEAPGFEEIVALGTLCGITDPDTIFQIKALCDSLGFDPIAMGGAIACVMGRGEDRGKESLCFGDGRNMLEMMSLADPGEVLTRMGISVEDGSESEWIGFMNTDPRGDPFLALNRLTWPLAEPNLLGSVIFAPLLPVYHGLGNGPDAASAVAAFQDLSLGLETLGFCPWSALCLGPGDLDRLVAAALGERVPSPVSAITGGDILTDLGRTWLSATNLESQSVSRFKKLAKHAVADGRRAGQSLRLEIKKYIDARSTSGGV